VLVFTDSSILSLQIVKHQTTIFAQSVTDPDEAAHAAEELWKMFVETPV
jgi:hypothetical protein